MSHLQSFLLLSSLSLILVPTPGLSAFSGGDGTELNPYLLTASDYELDGGDTYYAAMESVTIASGPALLVGNTTTGNVLEVGATDTVLTCNYMTIGSEEGSSGSVTVNDGASLLVDFTIHVGGSGTGSFTLANGDVSSANTIIGANSGSAGQARILGSSTWINTGAFRVSRGTLSIEEDSSLGDCSEFVIGSSSGSGAVTISGSSDLVVDGTLTLAKDADGLIISGASTVTSTYGDSSGWVVLEGIGTRWTVDEDLYARDDSVLLINDASLVRVGALLAYSESAIRLGSGYLAILGDLTDNDAQEIADLLGILETWDGGIYVEADSLDDLRFTFCNSNEDGLAFTGGIYGDLSGYTIIAAVPEPAETALITALAALAILRYRARRKA